MYTQMLPTIKESYKKRAKCVIKDNIPMFVIKKNTVTRKSTSNIILNISCYRSTEKLWVYDTEVNPNLSHKTGHSFRLLCENAINALIEYCCSNNIPLLHISTKDDMLAGIMFNKKDFLLHRINDLYIGEMTCDQYI